MTEQENLENVGIGTKEAQKLEPKIVKIVGTKVESVGEKGAKKVVCIVKHPEKEETISISGVKVERKGKLEVSGLWFNQDEDKMIRKGSSLALFMQFLKVEKVSELEGKECNTTEDDVGYLVFKSY